MSIILGTGTCFQFVSSLTTPRDLLVGIQNTITGYFAGGYNETDGFLSEIDTLTFNSGALRTLSATLQYPRVSMSSTGINTVGYFAGGSTTSSLVAEIDQLTYSDGTMATSVSALTAAKSLMGSVCSTTDGYFGGGYTNTQINSIDVLSYPTQTQGVSCYTLTSSTNSTSQRLMSGYKNSVAGMQNDTDGYFVGGYNGATPISIIDDLNFGTGTSSTTGTTLTTCTSCDSTCTAIDVALTTAVYNAASSSTIIPSLA